MRSLQVEKLLNEIAKAKTAAWLNNTTHYHS